MKKIKFLMLSLTILAATSAFAQEEKKDEGTSLSVGVEAALPIGDFSKSHNFGIGGSAKIAIPIFDGGAATVSAGYTTFSGKSETFTYAGVSSTVKNPSANIIPLKAGLKFKIAEGFYGEPQLGVSLVSSKEEEVDLTTGATSTKNSNKSYFTYAAGVGYVINNMIDVGVRYEAFSTKTTVLNSDLTTSEKTTSTGFIGLRIAYKFGL